MGCIKKIVVFCFCAAVLLPILFSCTDETDETEEIKEAEGPAITEETENADNISATAQPLDISLEWRNTLANASLLNRSAGKGKAQGQLNLIASAQFADTSVGAFSYVEDINYDGAYEYFYVRFGIIYCADAAGDILWQSAPQNRINILGIYELCGEGNGFTVVVSSDVSKLKFFNAATGELDYEHVFDTRIRIEAYNTKIGSFDSGKNTAQLIFFPYSWDKAYMFCFSDGVKNTELLWETDGIGKNDSYPATLMLADVWGEGVNNIVVCAFGRIMIYDLHTGKKLCEVKGNGIRNYGLCELRDIDGDNILEAAVICSQTETHVSLLKFGPKPEDGSVVGGEILWSSVYAPGSVTMSNAPLAFWDIDGDGNYEFLYNRNDTAEPGWNFIMLDAVTGEEKYRIADKTLVNIINIGGYDLFLMQDMKTNAYGFYKISGNEYEEIYFGGEFIFGMPYGYPLNIYDLYGTRQPYYGDFDGSGQTTLLSGSGGIYMLMDYSADTGFYQKQQINPEDGSFDSLRFLTKGPAVAGTAAVYAMTAADLNYDGKAELLAGGKAWALTDGGLQALSGYSIERTGYANQYAACVDEISGDGKKYIYSGANGSVSLYGDTGKNIWTWSEDGIVHNMDIISGHFRSKDYKDIAAVVSQPNMGLNKIILLDGKTGELVWESSDGHNDGTGLGPINYFLAAGDFDGDGLDDIIGVSHNYIMILDGKTGEKLYKFAVLLEEIGASSYLGAGNFMILDGIEEAEKALQGEISSLKNGVIEPDGPDQGVRHFYMQMTSNATGGRVINSDKGLKAVWINETGWMANPFGTPPLMTSPGIALGKDGSFAFLQQFPDFSLKCQDGVTGEIKWELDINMQDITSIITCDIDGDGDDEFIFCASDNKLYIVGYGGEIKYLYDLGARGSMPIVADFDGDGYVEIAVMAQDGFIYILS